MVGGGGAEQQLLHEPDPPPPGASFELLEERLRLEVLRDIVVEAGDDLVDLLLPAWVDVLAHLHGAEELPQRLLHHPAEARGDLCRAGRGGGEEEADFEHNSKAAEGLLCSVKLLANFGPSGAQGLSTSSFPAERRKLPAKLSDAKRNETKVQMKEGERRGDSICSLFVVVVVVSPSAGVFSSHLAIRICISLTLSLSLLEYIHLPRRYFQLSPPPFRPRRSGLQTSSRLGGSLPTGLPFSTYSY